MALEMHTLQDRDAWLEHRKNYIGGSEASCVLGLNPYKTNVELWEEKTGQMEAQDLSFKPYVQYGQDAEKHLRALFALDFPEYMVGYKENNSFVNDAFPFAAASLDGWLTEKETGRRGILEIKTTNILQSMQREKWRDRIPDNYYVQVLFYLGVTGWDFAVLKAQLKTEYNGEIRLTTRHYTINREDAGIEDDIALIMQKCAEFWEYVKAGRRPPLVLPSI